MTGHGEGFTTLTNGQAIPLAALRQGPLEGFQSAILEGIGRGQRVAALLAMADADPDRLRLFAVLADDAVNRLHIGVTVVSGESFPSLTPRCPQVHLFEREMAEQFGVRPVGHPWLKPLRFHRSCTRRDAWQRPPDEPILPGVTDYYRVEGEAVHEVAVGPVHAGIIEPGHFRFQCYGERVFHLEIGLGYQHRGVEEAMVGGPQARRIHYVETLAGDTSIAHAMGYCQVLEGLARCQKSARAQTLRAVALELERMANHIGDLGALAGDVGFLPTANYCGRIRGDVLNMTAVLCGNRFGRGLVRPGGVGFDVDAARAEDLRRRLAAVECDVAVAVNLLWDTPSVMARFEGVGLLDGATAALLGVVGPAARASGLSRDVRKDHPAGIYRFVQVPASTCGSGDVYARAYVRWLELQQSIAFVREQLGALPAGELLAPLGSLAPNSITVTLNEGWRGEVCHVAITDAQGSLARYKVVDPSFHNWSALAYVMRNKEISDFPLCNKSFSLSYCGHDL